MAAIAASASEPNRRSSSARSESSRSCLASQGGLYLVSRRGSFHGQSWVAKDA